MKKFTALVLGLTILVAACGDDDTDDTQAAPDPATVSTCEGLADATIDLTQDVIDALGALTPEEFAAISEGAVTPEFAAIADRGLVIGTRAQELECTTIDDLVAERADQLTAADDNAIGLLVIEGVKTGEDVLARLFR